MSVLQTSSTSHLARRSYRRHLDEDCMQRISHYQHVQMTLSSCMLLEGGKYLFRISRQYSWVDTRTPWTRAPHRYRHYHILYACNQFLKWFRDGICLTVKLIITYITLVSCFTLIVNWDDRGTLQANILRVQNTHKSSTSQRRNIFRSLQTISQFAS